MRKKIEDMRKERKNRREMGANFRGERRKETGQNSNIKDLLSVEVISCACAVREFSAFEKLEGFLMI